jgi:prevent-host-death family protein
MVTVNIHEAKMQLSKLVDRAARGAPFVITKAGKPLVKVAAIDAPKVPRRLGFLSGEITVPKDFDRMGDAEIAAMFRSEAGSKGVGTPHQIVKYPVR